MNFFVIIHISVDNNLGNRAMPKQLCKKDPDQRIWKALSESTVDELIGVLDIPSSKDLGNKKEEPKDGEFRRLMLKSPIELKYLYDICISYLAFFFRFDQTPQGLRLLKLQPLSCLSVKIFEEQNFLLSLRTSLLKRLKDVP